MDYWIITYKSTKVFLHNSSMSNRSLCFIISRRVLASLLTLREIVTKYARISCILPVCNFREKSPSLGLDINHISHTPAPSDLLHGAQLNVLFLVITSRNAIWCSPNPTRATNVSSSQRETASRYVVRNIIGWKKRVCILQNITSHHITSHTQADTFLISLRSWEGSCSHSIW